MKASAGARFAKRPQEWGRGKHECLRHKAGQRVAILPGVRSKGKDGNEMVRVLVVLLAFATQLVAADFTGAWAGATSNLQTATPIYLMLNQDGQSVSGTISMGPSAKPIPIQRAEIRNDDLTFEVRDNAGHLDRFAVTFTSIGGGLAGDPRVVLKGEAALGDGKAAVIFYPTGEEQVYAGRQSASAPMLLRKSDPVYTEEARQAQVQGTVLLGIEIDPAGIVSTDRMRVVRSLGYGLDEKAIECVRQWRFRPAFKGGFAVKTQATIEVNFRL
jgi:TonB family protein